jgi:hypothetical protein
MYRNDEEGCKLIEEKLKSIIPDEFQYYQTLKEMSKKESEN